MNVTHSTVALVTGGGSGLGAATTRRLVADGIKVVIADLDSSPGAALADELGEGVRFVAVDVRDEEQMQAAVDAATSMGELRIAVACAGVATPGRIVNRKGPLPLEKFRTVLDINVVGTFNMMRLAAAAMVRNEDLDGDRGVMVMTASVAAFDGQVGQAAYATSKAAVVGLTLTAARDLAEQHIRVVTVAPGTFETPMLAALPDQVRASLAAVVPHPARLGKPEEFADMVRCIVGNGMLNGETIRLDGALRMPPR